jgi:hypothetical protein
MRKLIPLLAAAFVCSVVSLAVAAETKTITGGAVCAKCALKEKPQCQNAVIVKENGKDVTYYLEGDKSKKVHQSFGICSAKKDAPVQVKVTGTVEEKDGKKVMTVENISKNNKD